MASMGMAETASSKSALAGSLNFAMPHHLVSIPGAAMPLKFLEKIKPRYLLRRTWHEMGWNRCLGREAELGFFSCCLSFRS
jgi:hypothetical protein